MQLTRLGRLPGLSLIVGRGKIYLQGLIASVILDRNGRLEYAKELSKYISVDIYGACSNKTCPRSSGRCFDMLNNQYKFYLAFENSNCQDYITEKFFVNGLG